MKTDKLPFFKYNPNIYENDYLVFKENICQCCRKKVSTYIQNMYTSASVDCICLDCVADGTAAKKFDGLFVQDADKLDNDEAKQELFYRTPGYWSWQGEQWVGCCNDYCAYIGPVGTKELEELKIADEFFEEDGSFNDIKNAREYMTKEGSLCGYLFQCIHCGKYHLRMDFD